MAKANALCKNSTARNIPLVASLSENTHKALEKSHTMIENSMDKTLSLSRSSSTHLFCVVFFIVRNNQKC